MSLQRLIILSAAFFVYSGLNAQISLPPEEADKYHTKLLVSRLKQQLGKIVPRKHKDLPPEQQCIVHYPGSLENPGFSIRADAYPIRIYLPHNFYSWALRKDCLLPFVHAHLTARTGIREPLKDVWLSAALIQEIFEPGTVYGTAGYGNMPYARAMLAHGYVPAPALILNSSMDDFYRDFFSAARTEWCSILLKLALKKNALREQDLVKYNNLSPAQKFERLLSEKEKTPKKKNLFTEKLSLSDDWFYSAASAMILGRGIPAAVPRIEEKFQTILNSIQPYLKLPENNTGKGLDNETVKHLVQAEIKLNQLTMIVPDRVSLKLFRYVKAIRQFRKDPCNKNNLHTLRVEEQAVFEALSERADLEYSLRLAEQRLIPPGTRLALTLRAAAPKHPDIPILQKANQLMDHFEKDF